MMHARHACGVAADARRGLDESLSCPRMDCGVSSRGNTREVCALSRNCADFKSATGLAVGFGDLADALQCGEVSLARDTVGQPSPLKRADTGFYRFVILI